MNRKYEEIIGLAHPTSALFPRMSMSARAAQFAPYAALTGYDAIVREEARHTESRPELDEQRKEELDRELRRLISEGFRAEITYFLKDKRKKGGKIVTVAAKIVTFDPVKRSLTLDGESEITVDEILDVKEETENEPEE